MANVIAIPEYDLTMYEGATFNHEFRFALVDENGDETGPYALGSNPVRFRLNDVTREDILLATNESADSSGSLVEILNGGESTERVHVKISAQALLSLAGANENGRYRIEHIIGTNVTILLRGSVIVERI